MNSARWLALTLLVGTLFSVATPSSAAAPSNDSWSAATSISAIPFSATQDTAGATADSVGPSDCGGEATVWYRFVAPSDGLLVVQTRGSSFDTVLRIFYDSPGVVNGPCNDDAARQRSVIQFHADAGRTYFVEAGGLHGATGRLKLAVNGGGTLTGIARDGVTGSPVPGICLTVFTSRLRTGDATTTSAADGSYTFRGLPSGEYRPQPCTETPRRARQWPMPAFVAESRGTVAPDLLLDSSVIRGVVTGEASGSPVANLCVLASEVEDGLPYFYATTSSTGEYSTAVAPGTYTVQFCGDASHAGEYFPGVATPTDAAEVVAPPAGAVDVDASLQLASTVSGRIVDEASGNALRPACVFANSVSDGSRLGYASNYQSTTGAYTISGLPPVPVRLYASECNTSPGTHAPEFFNDSASEAGATVTNLVAGGSTTADFALAQGSRLTGVVRRDADSAPVAGACVDVVSSSTRETGRFFTDANGRYAMSGLPAGDLFLRFGCADFAPEWFSDATSRADATALSVPGTAANLVADGSVAVAGTAHGRIADPITGKSSPDCVFRTVAPGLDPIRQGDFGQRSADDVFHFGPLATLVYDVMVACGPGDPVKIGSINAAAGSDVDFGTIPFVRSDEDEDGVSDAADNCPLTPNQSQADSDADDLGDVCDIEPAAPSGPPKLSVSDRVVREWNRAHSIQVHVRLSKATSSNVSVRFQTSNGTAAAGSDYVAVNKIVTLPGGTTDAVVSLTIRGDAVKEPNETFTVNLSSPTGGAVIGRGKATVTLTNDD